MSESTLGSRIAVARKRLGMTQGELAAKEGCGGHAPRIAELEGDKVNPQIDRVRALAAALEVDVAWLITGDPSRAPAWMHEGAAVPDAPEAA